MASQGRCEEYDAGTSFSLTKAFWFNFLFCCWKLVFGGDVFFFFFFLFLLLPLGCVIWNIQASWKMEEENQYPHIFQLCIGQFWINRNLLAMDTTKGSLPHFLYCYGVEIRGGVTRGHPACTDSWRYGLRIVRHVPRSLHGCFHSVSLSLHFPGLCQFSCWIPEHYLMQKSPASLNSPSFSSRWAPWWKLPKYNGLLALNLQFLLHGVYETTEQSAWWHKSLKTRIPQGHSVRQPLTNVLTKCFWLNWLPSP